jgi:hypothetical protein
VEDDSFKLHLSNPALIFIRELEQYPAPQALLTEHPELQSTQRGWQIERIKHMFLKLIIDDLKLRRLV